MEKLPERYKSQEFVKKARHLASACGGGRRVLICTHSAPDGDALAALLAAADIIRILNSHPQCVLAGPVPERFSFLPGAERIIADKSKCDNDYQCVLMVDASNLSRITDVKDIITSEMTLVNVDHHQDNEFYGSLNIVYPEASSTTEILYYLLRVLDLPISRNLAMLLYTGLLTDTGCFRFENTSEYTLSVAAQLIGYGANPSAIAAELFSNNSADNLRLLGQALTSLELCGGGRVAVMTVYPRRVQDEMEELVDYALSIKSVRAAVFFRVLDGVCRVSLRSRGAVEVARIAHRFGGGGHPQAAGFVYRGSLTDIRSSVVEALCEEVANPGSDCINAK